MAFNIKPSAQPILTSSRLLLRRPEDRDAEAIIALVNDKAVARRLARVPYPYGHSDVRFFLDHVVNDELCWLVTLRADGTVIGTIGLAPNDDPPRRNLAIGWDAASGVGDSQPKPVAPRSNLASHPWGSKPSLRAISRTTPLQDGYSRNSGSVRRGTGNRIAASRTRSCPWSRCARSASLSVS